jgi:hypothetical protein
MKNVTVQLPKKIREELEQAHHERARGNEGRARVCARRAAGWAIAAYRQHEEGVKPPVNALHLLRWLQGQQNMDEEMRLAAARLTIRVTQQHTLPHDEDPLQDAEVIIRYLSHDLG